MREKRPQQNRQARAEGLAFCSSRVVNAKAKTLNLSRNEVTFPSKAFEELQFYPLFDFRKSPQTFLLNRRNRTLLLPDNSWTGNSKQSITEDFFVH